MPLVSAALSCSVCAQCNVRRRRDDDGGSNDGGSDGHDGGDNGGGGGGSIVGNQQSMARHGCGRFYKLFMTDEC